MRNPKTLDVYPLAVELACGVYRVTSQFPPAERYGLTQQLRRASISVGSNIFEGCGRRTDREFGSFLYNANGSAFEIEFQLDIAERLAFGEREALTEISALNNRVRRMLSSLAKKVYP